MPENCKHYDVIVLGVGSMGSAACYHLAKRGISVLGIDRFEIPHNQGSHHGKSRMIRKAYYEHPDYVPLLERAYELWDQLEHDSSEQILYKNGALYLCGSEESVVSGSLRSALKYSLNHTHIQRGSLPKHFPQFMVPAHFEGFLEPEGGFLRPELGVQEHARQAEKLGAILMTRTEVFGWDSSESGVEIYTDSGKFFAKHLVICAGPWAQQVTKPLGIELTVTRQVQAWFAPKEDAEAFTPDNFPCWFIETQPPFGHYGFPILPGQKGLKIAEHRPGIPISTENTALLSQAPNDNEIEQLRSVLETHIQGSAGNLLKACTCLYTNSPDQHFIIGNHPKETRVSIAAGFSGHGYKFASVIGEVLADLAINGKTEHPIAFLSPDRFSSENS